MPAHRPLSFDPIEEARRQWDGHGWGEVADGMAAVTSIVRLQQVFVGRADEILRAFGLTFARYEALMLLVFTRQGALPLGKIGERLQVHPASVTNAINRLEADGLVTRRANPADGRGTLAAITPAGRRAAARATRELNPALFGTIDLTPRELSELFRLLGKLRRAAGDFE